MSRRIRNIAILALVACSFGIAIAVLFPHKHDTHTHIYMLDIGQGDSFLIMAPNQHTILIDGGPDATVLSALTRVLPAGKRTIDVMIATHPDADHIAGLSYVLDRYRVGLFLTSDVRTDTKTFKNLYQKLDSLHVNSYYARRGMKLMLSNSTALSILFPDRPTTNWVTNPASVIGRLDVRAGEHGASALFTGDAPASVEHFLVSTIPSELDVDVLKLGHHGSKYSSSDEFLAATSPDLALISAGVHNRYGHPNVEVLNRLRAHHIPWISTAEKGTVDLSTDGMTWSEKSEK